jgi:hypothetical protein
MLDVPRALTRHLSWLLDAERRTPRPCATRRAEDDGLPHLILDGNLFTDVSRSGA